MKNKAEFFEFVAHGQRFVICYVEHRSQWEIGSFPGLPNFQPETLRLYRAALDCLQVELDKRNGKVS